MRTQAIQRRSATRPFEPVRIPPAGNTRQNAAGLSDPFVALDLLSGHRHTKTDSAETEQHPQANL
jgi:hypothetical protein